MRRVSARSCTVLAVAIAESARAGAAAPVVGPARWFPVVSSGESRAFSEDADGAVELVERGLRLVEHPDGRIERAPDLLPSEGELSVVRLPSRLGGGVLFSSRTDAATRLYRSASWTSALVPLVKLGFETKQVVPGFDRVFAVSARTHGAVGIDASTGAILGDGALPEAAAYGGMAFSSGWVGAVETDVRGVLVTFDAGATYHPIGIPTTVPGVTDQGGRVVIGTPRGNYVLSPSGELERTAGSDGTLFGDLSPSADDAPTDQDDTPMDEPSFSLAPSVLGARPLEVAVLRGYPEDANYALVVASGTLARVRLSDGKIVKSHDRVVPALATCTAIRLFSGVGFVCGERQAPTRVYAFRAPLALEQVFEFPEPRTVSASGTGALAVEGPCPGRKLSTPNTYCIVSAGGTTKEIAPDGAARVAAFADGRAAVLVPPRPDARGTLSIVGIKGDISAHPLSLAKVPPSTVDLLERGLWENGMVEIEPGVLSGWVVGASNFVGVRIGTDGTVTAGTVRSDAPRASLSGRVGAVTDDRGEGYETTNGGSTWDEIALPVHADVIAEAPTDRERGCSLVGCGLGSWLRVGWGKGPGKQDLSRAEDPPVQKSESNYIVTWALDCTATGEKEGPSEVAQYLPRKAGAEPRESAPPRGQDQELESSAWRMFLGALGPERAPGDLGFDFGTEDQRVQVRGYAWGGRGAAWDRTGSWVVRAVDRFAVKRAVWSTAVSRSPFADAAAAAETFGSEPTHRVANEWSADLDPLDRGGVLRVKTGMSADLSVIEDGRAIVVARNPDDISLDGVAVQSDDWEQVQRHGAVKALGKWFVGSSPGGRLFQILAIDGGRLTPVASLRRQSDSPFARVVRTTKGDALGVWVIARGLHGMSSSGDEWLIHPIDPKSGEVSEPLVVSRDTLRRAPRVCEPEETGWVLVAGRNPATLKIELGNVADPPAIERVEARLIAGPSGICIDALAAQVEGNPPRNLNPIGADARARRGAELALTDRATDRRWAFRCSP